MSTKTYEYTIRSAGDPRLSAYEREVYATREEAVAAVKGALRWDDVVVSDEYAVDDGNSYGVSLYETEEECDTDQEGAHAPRVVRRRKAVTVPAKRYEDHDDSLTAAAEDVAEELGLEAWQVEAHWDDEQERENIVVTVR